jgi:hypothetical protein
MSDVGYGGQRLASKSKCLNSGEVLIRLQLGGSKPLAHDAHVFQLDAVAVVLYLQQLQAAAFCRHIYPPRTGI